MIRCWAFNSRSFSGLSNLILEETYIFLQVFKFQLNLIKYAEKMQHSQLQNKSSVEEEIAYTPESPSVQIPLQFRGTTPIAAIVTI